MVPRPAAQDGAILNWGVVSTARINDEVLPQIEASSRARLAAVASRDPDRAARYAESHGIPAAHGSYEDLFADPEIDCVYVSIPNRGHAEVSAQALRAGKHVLCEKPLAVSAEEAAWLFQLAAECDRHLAEAFMYRHHDKTRRLGELVRRGGLGEIEFIRSWFHFRAQDPIGDIRFQPDLAGGSLRDIGSYCTSLALFLTGERPVRVSATARLSEGGVDRAFSGLLQFPSGTVALFDCSMVADLDLGVTVVGSEGRAHVDTPWYPHLAPWTIATVTAEGPAEIQTTDANAYLLEIDNFCAVVRGQAAPTVTPEDTLTNLAVMDELAGAAGLPYYALDTKGVVSP